MQLLVMSALIIPIRESTIRTPGLYYLITVFALIVLFVKGEI